MYFGKGKMAPDRSSFNGEPVCGSAIGGLLPGKAAGGEQGWSDPRGARP